MLRMIKNNFDLIKFGKQLIWPIAFYNVNKIHFNTAETFSFEKTPVCIVGVFHNIYYTYK